MSIADILRCLPNRIGQLHIASCLMTPILAEPQIVASLGITWKQVRDYPIGSKKVKVHYVPADEATYHLLTNDLGNKYRDAYRKSRCMIPGTLKPLIRCPDENKCSECPYLFVDTH